MVTQYSIQLFFGYIGKCTRRGSAFPCFSRLWLDRNLVSFAALRTVVITFRRCTAPGRIAAGALAAFALSSFNAQAQQVPQQGGPAAVLGSPIYAGPVAPPVQFVSGDSSPVFLGPSFSGGPGYINPGFGSLADFEAPGVKSGDFLVKQAVSTGITYDNNIFQSHSNGPASAIFFVSPGIDIIKDSGRSVQEVIASAVSADA